MSKKFNYTINDIEDSINKLNINKGDNIYVSCNLANLGFPKLDNINSLPELLFKHLKKKISKKGTIIVPTHSFFLKDSKKKFYSKFTPCESGAFSSYILKKKKLYKTITSISICNCNRKKF